MCCRPSTPLGAPTRLAPPLQRCTPAPDRSSIDKHLKHGHPAKLALWLARVDDDSQLKLDLVDYFKENPNEQMASVQPDEMAFRYRAVETFISSGVALSKVDAFRPLLQRSGYALTTREHLTLFIPKIEANELKVINVEVHEQYIFIEFDGTTRLGEAINVTCRFITADFRVVRRLLDFTTLEKHADNIRLATHVTDIVMRQRNVPPLNVIGWGRDSCSTNGAAARRMLNTFSGAVDMLCISHTLCHVGEHFVFSVLDAFMTPWLILVGGRDPHHGAKALWKETVAPATVPGFSHIRWYAKAEIIFVIAEAGLPRLRGFLTECETRDYGDVTRKKMVEILDTRGDDLRLELAGMLDVRKVVSITYELEGCRLEVMCVFNRVEGLRAFGRSLHARADGILPNVDAVLRRTIELKKGVTIEKFFRGHGVAVGTLDKKEKVDSTLYPGQERDAWLVKYADGTEEHFEEEELRSGKDGAQPAAGDGKPVLIVRHLPERVAICDSLIPGFDYLEKRITGTCEPQYSCVAMYEICRVIQAFDPNFAAAHLNPAFVDAMQAITPLLAHGLIDGLKQELPLYLAAAATAPVFDKSDVEDYSEALLSWWRTNGKGFPTWALAARMAFAISPNSAECERVFSLVKNMFGDLQLSSLADYIRAALMLKYNGRRVG